MAIATDNHSLSPRWLTSRDCSLMIRWPFFKAKKLDRSHLAFRLARRRGLRLKYGEWTREPELKTKEFGYSDGNRGRGL